MAKKATKKKTTKKSSSSSSSKKSTAAGGAGRPQGSKNVVRPSVEHEVSQCPKCGSTEKRSLGQGPMIQKHNGIHHGKAYTHIVRRRVVCQCCGQQRVDVTRENRRENIAAGN